MIYLLNGLADSKIVRVIVVLGIIMALFAGMATLMQRNSSGGDPAVTTTAAFSAAKQVPQKTLLVFGDSLVAGYGLMREQAFPAQLEKKLQADGYAVKVINAGVSGDTTSGGLTRLDWTLDQQHIDYAIVELGANDMLRQIDPKITRANLQKILEAFKAKKIPVLLAGMKSFSNFGDLFGTAFQKIYSDLSDDYDTLYYPFFLQGVAMNAELNIDDGMHPNPRGVGMIVDGIYPDVKKLLKRKID